MAFIISPIWTSSLYRVFVFGTGIGTRGVGLELYNFYENYDENVKSEIKSVIFATLGL